jgi:uncharacterized surface protein with fasciclin (FAS1) repeats
VSNFFETLAADGSFQTLLAILEEAGLTDMLKEPGPATLFAPDDDAFQRVDVAEIVGDREQLVSLLAYHLVDGKLTATDISREEHLITSSGKSLTVHLEEGEQVIDNARYVRTDIECASGIIHVIDNVFLPRFSGWYCGSCC